MSRSYGSHCFLVTLVGYPAKQVQYLNLGSCTRLYGSSDTVGIGWTMWSGSAGLGKCRRHAATPINEALRLLYGKGRTAAWDLLMK